MAHQKDEVGHTGIYPSGVPVPDDAEVLTPGDINSGHTGRRREQEALVPIDDKNKPVDDRIKNAERLPRKGDELDDLRGQPTD